MGNGSGRVVIAQERSGPLALLATVLLAAVMAVIAANPSPGGAQSPIMLGGICAQADQMPDQACGCTVDRLLVAGVRPAMINDLVRGNRAPYPEMALGQFDEIVERCIADPDHANRASDAAPGIAPGEPLAPGLPSGMGSPYAMCTRTLSIVGEQCGCMANRARAAGIADPVAARLFASDGSRASRAEIAAFEGFVRECSGYPIRIRSGEVTEAAPPPTAAPASAPRAGPPVRLRAGVDPRFRFRMSNLYPGDGLYAPTAGQFQLFEYLLDQCGTRACAEARGRLQPEDFGIVLVDLNQTRAGAHAIMVPVQGGQACRANGCFWTVFSGNATSWGSIQEDIGFGTYLAVAGEYGGHAVLHEEEDRDGRAHYYFELRRDIGTYGQVGSSAQVADAAREAAAMVEAGRAQAGTAQAGGLSGGRGRVVRDSRGNPFALLDGLPVMGEPLIGEPLPGPDERVIASIGAEYLQRSKGAGLDYGFKGLDGTSPTMRITGAAAPMVTFSGISGGPDVYQVRVFYRTSAGGAVVATVSADFGPGDEWGTVETLISPAYPPQDPYDWAVGIVTITNPDEGRFGGTNAVLREVSVGLGLLTQTSALHVDRIELVALGYPRGHPLLEPYDP